MQSTLFFEITPATNLDDTIKIFLYDENEIDSYCGSIHYSERQSEFYYFEDVMTEDEFDLIFSKTIYYCLDMLNVSKNKRNKGYANILMKKFLELTKGKDKYLNACAAKNDPGALTQQNLVRFYEKFGFVEYVNQGNNSMMINTETYHQ